MTRKQPTNSDLELLYVTKTSILDDGGGGEKRAREVLSELSSRGHESTVVCGRTKEGLSRWASYEGNQIRHVTCTPESLLGDHRLGFLLPRYLFAFASLPVILWLLFRNDYDVIIENMTPYPTLTVLLAKLFNTPIVAVQHEFHGKDCLNLYDPITGRIQLLVQNIFCVFEYEKIIVPATHVKKQLRSYGIATEEITVIPNGINYSVYNKPNIKRKSNRLITVGRLCNRKGQAELLRGFARLHKRNTDIHLDVVGKGPQREYLEELTHELGIKEKVTFHGFVEHERKVQLLNQSNAFIFASHQEGFGLVLLEAMAAGLPVIARRLPVYEDFFEDQYNGYLVDGHFPKNFPALANELLNNKTMMAKIRQNNSNKAKKFSWENTAELTERLLMKINKDQ